METLTKTQSQTVLSSRVLDASHVIMLSNAGSGHSFAGIYRQELPVALLNDECLREWL